MQGEWWWLVKANLERGGHRPKKGLLRGGKNRKKEGYVPSGGKGDRRRKGATTRQGGWR